MKYPIVIVLLISNMVLNAQILKPSTLSVAYFGETATHPGLKLGITYPLKTWEKTKIKKNGTEELIHKTLDISPSLGFFFHKDYQTGLFVLPEFRFLRKNKNGNYIALGIGAGYMRTFVPNVYEINALNEIGKVHTGNNYFITNCALIFGKDLSIKKAIPLDVFIKPQMLYAVPNVPKGVWYFALEIGASFHLKP